MMRDINAVLGEVKAHNVGFVEVWFTDILGTLKSITVPVERLGHAFEEGVPFDGSSIEGFTRVDESDMFAFPDPSTFAVLPQGVGRMIADIRNLDGKPFEGDPRFVLKKTLERAAAQGYAHHLAPEIEYFVFKSAAAPDVVDRGGYFDAIPREAALVLRRDTIQALEAMKIAVDYAHHEASDSQQEVDLREAEALQQADNVVTFKYVAKAVAQRHGLYATFMPKPINGQNGSGMHLHQALLKGGKSAFYELRDKWGVSETARRFIAGQMTHAPEIALVTNPTVNSYKRLVPGYEAPVYVTWATRNRSDLIRVPTGRKTTLIEYRAPDPSANPYLAFAALLAAGLEGIEKSYACPPPSEENVYAMPPERRREMGVREMPGSLVEAIHAAEKSDLLRRTLGDHVFHNLIESKKIEWNEFRTFVTQFEVERYLPTL
jgi:glutamine synthetase